MIGIEAALAEGLPRGDVSFSDHSLPGYCLIVEIRSFMRANEILSCFHLDFNLSRSDCHAATVGPLAHTEAAARIVDIYSAYLDLQFFRPGVLDVEKGIPSQQLDAGRFGIGDSHAAVAIKADIDVGSCRNGDALSGNGFVQPRRKWLRDKPGQESEKQSGAGDGEMNQETAPAAPGRYSGHIGHIGVLIRDEP